MREIASLRPFRLVVVVAATVMTIVSVSVSVPAPAWGAGAEDANAVQARRHYEEGTKAFNLGEFPRAIAEFKSAYNAKPDPLLLYNIAQSYRLAEDAGQALFFYKSFLRNMPGATNRKEVEAHIRKLERQVEDQKREPGTMGTAAIAPPPPAIATPSPAASPPPSSPTPSASPRASGDRESTMRLPPQPAAAPAGTETGASGQVDLTSPPVTPAPAEEEDRPLYKKWWFWAGAVGAVLIVGGLANAAAQKQPSTALGTFDPRFDPAM